MRLEPYWRSLHQGFHLGYRRRANGGSWIVRRRINGGYIEAKLGAADDTQDPDGLKVLSYRQAQEAARKWFHEQVKAETGGRPAASEDYTVADALRDYFDWYVAKGGK